MSGAGRASYGEFNGRWRTVGSAPAASSGSSSRPMALSPSRHPCSLGQQSRCRGVLPSESTALTSAPASSRSLTA